MCLGVVGSAVVWATSTAEPHRYDTVTDVPSTPVALVFGNRVYPDGTVGRILAARLDLARRLYQAGKVRVLLVSGDDSGSKYNEVDTMRSWLIGRGVPANRIVADHAGFDTYSTCVRASRVFGVTRATIVTQGYHMPRALTLCRAFGIDAVGVDAGTMDVSAFTMARRSVRDAVACVEAVYQVVAEPELDRLGPRLTVLDEALAGP